MATLNGAASFFGSGSMPVFAGRIWQNAISALFSGKGLLDDFRVSNRYDYDPNSWAGPGDMKLRKARLSQEGIFGDD